MRMTLEGGDKNPAHVTYPNRCLMSRGLESGKELIENSYSKRCIV